ncbi:helix-turn-helix domain-containing protein [Butyrivibrio sp. INlla21]|uniref:helix-turn-helix domain-containing protein n=1 Tax=Butyrivibrio sp. INlla21 TaxID=1520811 RepID=UPI0008E196E3|nr:helix-turn-helix transcriptional regulator [Butyrivibrio sp. INlla21]SFU97295.1 Helix-turn-helix [Butyrivibrio sp. INlla21]
MSNKFDDFLKEQLKDPEFREEYEALQPEHAVIQAIIDARKDSGLTQKELADKTGIAQGDISKLERGTANPSLKTLQRLAAGMGKVLKIEFLPDGKMMHG